MAELKVSVVIACTDEDYDDYMHYHDNTETNVQKFKDGIEALAPECSMEVLDDPFVEPKTEFEWSRKEMMKQVDMVEHIQEILNLNIVTCGNCGQPIIHDMDYEEITCPWCVDDDGKRTVGEPCDHPDLFYREMM